MTYHSLAMRGLGQEDSVTERCWDQVKSGDLDSKAGREKAFKTGAQCAADGYCATYGVPPGVCGAIAGAVAEGITDIWNGIFGNEEEWEAYRARQAAHAAGARAATQAMVADAMIACAFYKTAGQLADLWDKSLPEKKGFWGPRQGPWTFEARDFVKEWATSGADYKSINVCSTAPFTFPKNTGQAPNCSPLYSWMITNGMNRVGVYCDARTAGASWPTVYGQAMTQALTRRPAFVKQQMDTHLPQFMAQLGETAAKFGAMVAGLVAKREAEAAARNKAAWEQYELARKEGEKKTAILNFGLVLGGAALLGGVWFLGRRS